MRRAQRRSCVAINPGEDGGSWQDRRFYKDDSLVEWSSITKTVTARLLMQLARAGKVDPQLPVSVLFPQLPLEGATLQDLCRHRSGLPTMHPGAKPG